MASIVTCPARPETLANPATIESPGMETTTTWAAVASPPPRPNGELRAIQVGGRAVWRLGLHDLECYIAAAYRRTAERVAADEIVDDGEPNLE
ncbi:hypothetical protein QFZ65_001294 [Arthrobacter sp. B3I9]|uniref:hypothetical protein n=1 Tax=Arthrobacter sp. B3I9 TaxID=3042270 RepID=UPI00278F24D1|nr:hypothetical protein [Arthrobacter sp. B3I9]MDQ0849356.1 hypothetical protein [Arthrobacter sp. B3I9]